MGKILILNIGKAMEMVLMGSMGALSGTLKKCESGTAHLLTEDGKLWVAGIDKIIAVSLK